jgi:opacity protein-like surface antigen
VGKKIGCLTLLSLVVITPILASNVEISAAGGLTWLNAGNSSIVISPIETDTLRVNNITSSAIWRAGVGYHAFAAQLSHRSFLNDLLLELNGYYSNMTIRGNVYQYQSSDYNNYSFRAPITSTRLMFDVKPGLFTYQRFSSYAIFGAGVAFNNTSYAEEAIDSSTPSDSPTALQPKQNIGAAYDLGIGVSLVESAHLKVLLEYLYTYMGNVSPSNTSGSGAVLANPPAPFGINTQSAFLGFNWRF